MAEEDPNELCKVCGEARGLHIPTAKGPLTHPREAREEGVYVRTGNGTHHMGLFCQLCHGPCDGHEWENWEFKTVQETSKEN